MVSIGDFAVAAAMISSNSTHDALLVDNLLEFEIERSVPPCARLPPATLDDSFLRSTGRCRPREAIPQKGQTLQNRNPTSGSKAFLRCEPARDLIHEGRAGGHVYGDSDIVKGEEQSLVAKPW